MSERNTIQDWFRTDTECISAEQAEAYRLGKLTGQEKHAVERHLLTCDLCAEAWEGLEMAAMDGTLVPAVADITDRAWTLAEARERKKRRGAFVWMSAAAGVALIVVAGFFLYKNGQDQKLDDVFAQQYERYPAEESAPPPPTESLSDLEAEEEAEVRGLDKPIAAVDAPDMDQVDLEMDYNRLSQSRELELVNEDAMDAAPMADLRSGDIADRKSNEVAFFQSGTADIQNKDAVATKSDGIFISDESNSEELKKTTVVPDPRRDAEKLTNGVELNGTLNKNTVTTTYQQRMTEKKAPSAVTDPTAYAKNKESINQLDVSSRVQKSESKAKGRDKIAGNKSSAGKSTDNPYKTAMPAKEDIAKEKEEYSLAGINDDSDLDKYAVAADSLAIKPGAVASTPQTQSKSLLEQGIEQYGKDNFAECFRLMQLELANSPQNPSANFYSGLSKLGLNKATEAIPFFNAVLNSGTATASLKNEAAWYKALALIKNKELAKAKDLLNLIVAGNGKYASRAKETLKSLD